MASGCFNRDVRRIYLSDRHEIAREPTRGIRQGCQKLKILHVTDLELDRRINLVI